MTRIIEVVACQSGWPVLFQREAAQLTALFGDELVAIHHIGSTAIPGIKAKPVIDILIEIKEIAKIDLFNDGMIALGYRPRGECLDAVVPGTPGRFYFSKETDGLRSHHVHVSERGHFQIQDLLNFRDYLRAHKKEALRYSELKHKLAGKFRNNNIAYIHGKNNFIRAAIFRAKAWKDSQTSACV